MPEPIGESEIFERSMVAKSEIVKVRLGNLSLLRKPNRHVCEITGFVDSAERCEIEGVGLK